MSFLSKKSWHAGSTKNKARVREAEEAAANEAKKTEQRRRELQEEREMETLRKLQGKAGSSDGPDRLDWMYKTPVDVRDDKLQDEYLLGKQMPEKRTETVVEKVAQAAGSLFVKAAPAPMAAADLKAKLREDPLMLIKQREAQHVRSLSATQAHLHRIREQDIEEDHSRRRERDERKDSSKDKHKHKHKHKHRSSRHEDGSNDEGERRKHKKRRHEGEETTNDENAKKPKLDEMSTTSSAPNIHEKSHTEGDRLQSPSDAPKSHREIRDGPRELHHDSRPPQRPRYDSEHRNNGNGRDYPTSSYDSERRETQYRRRDDYDRREPYRASYSRSSEYEERERHNDEDEFGRRRRDDRSENYPGRGESYGRRSEYNGSESTHHRREYDSGRYEGSRDRYDGRRDRGNRNSVLPEMTEEERLRMLAQMQGRAEVLHQARSALIDDSKVEASREQADHLVAAQASQARGEMPSFVTKMNEEMIKSTSVEDRVSRGRFYMQKGD